MSTARLTKFWEVYFEDGSSLKQPEDDRYSKYDDSKDHNPSSFQDILDKDSNVLALELGRWCVDLRKGLFYDNDAEPFSLEEEPLTDRKLIYYRVMRREQVGGIMGEPYVHQYAIGYEGKNSKGKVEKKVIFINV